MGFGLVKWVLDEAPADLTTRERLTLIAVARWSNDKTGIGDPWRRQIAEAVSTNEREIRKVLSELRRRGVLVWKGGGYRGQPTVWQFAHLIKEVDQAPPSS